MCFNLGVVLGIVMFHLHAMSNNVFLHLFLLLIFTDIFLALHLKIINLIFNNFFKTLSFTSTYPTSYCFQNPQFVIHMPHSSLTTYGLPSKPTADVITTAHRNNFQNENTNKKFHAINRSHLH